MPAFPCRGTLRIRPEGHPETTIPLLAESVSAAREWPGNIVHALYDNASHQIAVALEGEDVRYARTLTHGTTQLLVRTGGSAVVSQTVSFREAGEAIVSDTVTVPGGLLTDDSIGLLTLELELRHCHGLTLVGFTPWIGVHIDAGSPLLAIRQLSEYVYRHNSLISNIVIETAGQSEGEGPLKTWDGYIRFLEKFVQFYRQCFPYFESSARFRLVRQEKILPYERVRNITNKSLEYLSLHPDEWHEDENGIALFGTRVRPEHVLSNVYSHSYEIFENQVIVAFIESVLTSVSRTRQHLHELDVPPRSSEVAAGGADFLPTLAGPVQDIQAKQSALDNFEASLYDIYEGYQRIFPIQPILLEEIPLPTPIFEAIEQYRSIYHLLCEWFSLPGVHLTEERTWLSIAKSSRMYEYFVLIRLIEGMGPVSKKYYYPYDDPYPRENSSELCNTFLFEREDATWTLYYEPVIHAGRVAPENGLGLIRASSFTGFNLRQDEGQPIWTPDFVLRRTRQGVSTYWICDAKYSYPQTIVATQAKDLIFKYLFGLRTCSPTDEIAGLHIFCGKTDTRESAREFSLLDLDCIEDRPGGMHFHTISMQTENVLSRMHIRETLDADGAATASLQNSASEA